MGNLVEHRLITQYASSLLRLQALGLHHALGSSKNWGIQMSDLGAAIYASTSNYEIGLKLGSTYSVYVHTCKVLYDEHGHVDSDRVKLRGSWSWEQRRSRNSQAHVTSPGTVSHCLLQYHHCSVPALTA